MGNQVVIGLAEMAVVKPPQSIITYGLGSCIGLVLYDKVSKVSGMVHIVIPNYNKSVGSVNPAKFADTAPAALMNEMIKKGARRTNLVAKLAGGAHMFGNKSENIVLKVGERNATITKETLKKLRIPIVAEDIFGNSGRTVEFYSDTSQFRIKTVGKAEKLI